MIWTNYGYLPRLPRRFEGNFYFGVEDFWLCGGQHILAQEPVLDVTVGPHGRYPCLHVEVDDPLPVGIVDPYPTGPGSVLHGRTEIQLQRQRLKFSLD